MFPQQKLQFKGSLSKRLKSVDVKCQKKVDLPDKRGNRREYALFFLKERITNLYSKSTDYLERFSCYQEQEICIKLIHVEYQWDISHTLHILYTNLFQAIKGDVISNQDKWGPVKRISEFF